MRELTYGPFGQLGDTSPRRVQSGAATRAENGDDQSVGRCLMGGMACGGHGIISSAANGVRYNALSHLTPLLSRHARVDRTARGVNRSRAMVRAQFRLLSIDRRTGVDGRA